jgi:hypothetical protein
MGIEPFLICLATVVFAMGLMQYSIPWVRQAGLVLFCGASVAAVWWWTQLWWMAFLTFSLWVMVPFWELVFVVRRLRVPQHRSLQEALPPPEFDQLYGITLDMNRLDFHQVDQCRLSPGLQDQFYRLFRSADGRIQAAITYVAHQGVGFHFLSLSSEDLGGRLWVTWNYPLTYGLKMPPGLALYRAVHCETPGELLKAHQDFLDLNEVSKQLVMLDETQEAARSRVEKTLQRQLDYNVRLGILAPDRTGDPNTLQQFRYSWRGTLYVAGQVLRDFVRL